jgi:DNA-binding XRE family transcriptional regulator
MPRPIRVTFAWLCRETRTELDVTQRELAANVGVSRAHIAAIETGRANPTLDLVTRIGGALGLELELIGRRPVIIGGHGHRDLVHARCSGYVDRRLRSMGWRTHREVEVVHGRSHGWVDLLAFDPRSRILLIVEVKTSIDDIGAIERQIGWYERSAGALARRFGWKPRTVHAWLLILASAEVDATIAAQRDVIRQAFPVRAVSMRAILAGTEITVPGGRGLALVDPSSRRRDWLIACRSDGRRTPLPYRDHRHALERLAGGTVLSA